MMNICKIFCAMSVACTIIPSVALADRPVDLGEQCTEKGVSMLLIGANLDIPQVLMRYGKSAAVEKIRISFDHPIDRVVCAVIDNHAVLAIRRGRNDDIAECVAFSLDPEKALQPASHRQLRGNPETEDGKVAVNKDAATGLPRCRLETEGQNTSSLYVASSHSWSEP